LFKKSIPPITVEVSDSGKNKEKEVSLGVTYDIDHEEKIGLVKIVAPTKPVEADKPQVPLDIVMLLDVSGSVSGYFDDFCGMTKDFVNKLGHTDRIGLITFSSTAQQEFPLQPCTIDAKKQMLASIKPAMGWGGSTNLMAGVIRSLEVIKEGQMAGRTMYFILVTDGMADSGSEGTSQLIELINISNVVVKMCTFGANIEAKILTNALSNKIQDYVHLADTTAFKNLINEIGLNRLAVVADNIELQINDQIFTLPQLREGEEIMYPFSYSSISEPVIRLKYKNIANLEQNLEPVRDLVLHDNINLVHQKKLLGDAMLKLLDQIQVLRVDQTLISNKTKFNENLKVHKTNLAAISDQIKVLKDSQPKSELLNLYQTIKQTLDEAENLPDTFLYNSSSSNTSYSTAFALTSSRSVSMPAKKI
jgi:hypothetical protein